MKIVIDTNVIVSGTFFRGLPYKLLNEVVSGDVEVIATNEILEEYRDIVSRFGEEKTGAFDNELFDLLTSKIAVIKTTSKVDVCRDPDDNKFLECAIDGNAIFIVSGDQDLLTINEYNGVLIVSVADYYSEILCEPVKR